jgi:small GTP-binding protein
MHTQWRKFKLSEYAGMLAPKDAIKFCVKTANLDRFSRFWCTYLVISHSTKKMSSINSVISLCAQKSLDFCCQSKKNFLERLVSKRGAKMSYSRIFKVVVTGAAQSGKSALVSGIVNGRIPKTTEPSFGAEFWTTTVLGQKIQIWDVGGDVGMKPTTSPYFLGSHIVLCVVDLTDCLSADGLETQWLPWAKKHCRDARFVFVGTKADRDHSDYNRARLQALANINGCQLFITSRNTLPDILGPSVASLMGNSNADIDPRPGWSPCCFM